jgi:hypothetical protein
MVKLMIEMFMARSTVADRDYNVGGYYHTSTIPDNHNHSYSNGNANNYNPPPNASACPSPEKPRPNHRQRGVDAKSIDAIGDAIYTTREVHVKVEDALPRLTAAASVYGAARSRGGRG